MKNSIPKKRKIHQNLR